MVAETERRSTAIETEISHGSEEKTAICPTLLIEDVPSEKDQFASHDGIGPHERVARTIADVILSPSESGGKMIGLEGDWGSGKTTVIGLLKRVLEKKDGITVFSYDAWAHEGDPLRRTFLETLIRHFQKLGNAGWIDKKNSNKVLDNLSQRRKVGKTRTIPKVTWLGRIFALSVLLVPIGSSLINSALRNEITINAKRPLDWTFIIGIFCALAPFLVIFGNFMRIALQTLNDKAQPNSGKDGKNSIDGEDDLDDWAFIGSYSIEEKIQETIETPQPTSIEFQDVFCNVMEEALQGKRDRKVIMVLDNLDRVDAKDALSIWSTLQTFLQCHNDRTDEWFKKLWIIIPYDPQGLRQLWINRGKDDGTHSEDAFKIVPESFMDKSFQLRFRVPPPVLSNWKDYLEMLSLQALPQHAPDELHRIYQVFRMTQGKDSSAPTPRELKLYVNQIGAIHRQWQHEFPLDHIAYYSILCRMRVSIREDLISGKIPDQTIKNILSPNAVANLAGLYFNVTAILGQQLLLSNEISNALVSHNDPRLKQLEEIHSASFWTVVESIMVEKQEAIDAVEIANTALCLESLSLHEKHIGSERDAILASLERIALNIQLWKPFRDNVPRGIQAILRLVSNPRCSSLLIEKLRASIADPALKADVPLNEITVSALAKICGELKSLGHFDALQPFTLATEADEWVNLCPHIYRQDRQWWHFFMPSAIFNNISDVIKNRVTSGTFTEDTVAAIEVTHQSSEKCDWTSLASTLQDRIGAEQNPTPKETHYLLKGMSLLKKLGVAQAQNSLDSLVTNGHLMHRLNEVYPAQDLACVARLLTIFLEHRSGAEKPGIVGNAEAGYNILSTLLTTDNSDLARHIVNILDAEDKVNILFNIIDKRGYDPLVVACLRLIAESDRPARLFTPDVVIARWKDLKNQLNQDGNDRFNKLLGYLCLDSHLTDAIQEREGGFDNRNILLYFLICTFSSSQTFREWCQSGLEALDPAFWKAKLDEGGDTLDFLLFLIDKGINVNLKQPFQDALVNHAKGILAGSAKPADDLVSKWPRLLDALRTPASRKTLRRRLLSEAMTQGGKCADAFFQIYGNELLVDTVFFYEEKNIVAKLFSPLIIERNVTGLRWLKKVFEIMPDLLEKAEDTDAVEDFIERIKNEPIGYAKDDDTANRLIWDIANTLGIKQPPRLEIIKAEYWTEKARLDVSEELRNSISVDKLETMASNDIKGDPDPGTLKKLTIEYIFDGITYTKEFTENEKVLIP